MIAVNLDADLTANPVAGAQRRQGESLPRRSKVNRERRDRAEYAETMTRMSLSVSGNDMRCAEAERYRNHFSLRQFQVNASSSFDQRHQRHPITV